MKTIFQIILLLVDIGLIFLILRQKGTDDGIGAAMGASTVDSHYNKNRYSTGEGRMRVLTWVLAFVAAALSIGLAAGK